MANKASSKTLEQIKGTSVIISPLGLQELDIVEEEALKQYKKRQIQTFTDNKEELTDLYSKDEMRAKVSEIQQLTAEDLPKKKMLVPRIINGEFIYDESKSVKTPIIDEIEIDYTGWWMSKTVAGRLLAIWLSLRVEKPGITKEEVNDMFKSSKDGKVDEGELDRVAEAVGEASRPTAGQAKND